MENQLQKLKAKKNKGKLDEHNYLLQQDTLLFNKGLEVSITPYVRLFTSFINTGRRVLLAHNKYVSIFNLSKEKWTKKHFKFEQDVR